MPPTPRRRVSASHRAWALVHTTVLIRGRRLAGGVLVTLATAGCGASGPAGGAFAGPPTPLVADPATYHAALAAGDVISIQFPYRSTFNQEVVVRTDGQINLPVIGTLPVVGRTPEEVQAEVRTRYLRHSYDPATAGERVYLIGVGDKLSFTYPGARQFDLIAVVRPDGRVTLPLIGAVRVEGNSADSLASLLSTRYVPHLQRSGVRVDIVEATTERTYANGQIVHTAVRDVEEASVIVRSFAPRQVFVHEPPYLLRIEQREYRAVTQQGIPQVAGLVLGEDQPLERDVDHRRPERRKDIDLHPLHGEQRHQCHADNEDDNRDRTPHGGAYQPHGVSPLRDRVNYFKRSVRSPRAAASASSAPLLR